MENMSGYVPTENKVLVLKKEVEKQTKGGIYLPDQTQEREKYATMEAVIVETSHLAFNYATKEEWAGNEPKPGDLVLIARHSGINVKGFDGKEYTLVNDKDIIAFVKEAQ